MMLSSELLYLPELEADFGMEPFERWVELTTELDDAEVMPVLEEFLMLSCERKPL